MILLAAALATVIFVYLQVYMEKRSKAKQPKEKKLWDAETIGRELHSSWVELSLQQYLQHRGVLVALEQCEQRYDVWVDHFLKNYDLDGIRCRKPTGVLAMAHAIGLETSEAKRLEQRRRLTVSAIVFSFAIPKELYYMDEKVQGWIHCYLVYHKHVTMHEELAKYQSQHVGVIPFGYNSTEIGRFYQLVDEYHTAVSVFAQFATQRYPNYRVLLRYLSNNRKEFMAAIHQLAAKDTRDVEESVKVRELIQTWATVHLTTLGLSVPRDYLRLNDLTVEYLLKTNRYPRPTAPRLSIVQNETA